MKDTPHVVASARVTRVVSIDTISVMISLRFGTYVQREIRIEGIDAESVPAHLRSAAMHCLVVLLGGKRVVVVVDDSDPDLTGRVYLDERIRGAAAAMGTPPGYSTPLLDVSAFFPVILGAECDCDMVKSVLNG